jgi:hypothetical protein
MNFTKLICFYYVVFVIISIYHFIHGIKNIMKGKLELNCSYFSRILGDIYYFIEALKLKALQMVSEPDFKTETWA